MSGHSCKSKSLKGYDLGFDTFDATIYLPLTSSTHGHLSPYLHPGTWVLTSGSLQLWDESARMKVQRWKCEDESVRMKVWGWKCEDENGRMKVRGWKCGDEKCKDESARMKVWGWKCGDENAEDEKSEDEKARGWKTKDESERMKYPRMKCHAAKITDQIIGAKSTKKFQFICISGEKTLKKHTACSGACR